MKNFKHIALAAVALLSFSVAGAQALNNGDLTVTTDKATYEVKPGETFSLTINVDFKQPFFVGDFSIAPLPAGIEIVRNAKGKVQYTAGDMMADAIAEEDYSFTLSYFGGNVNDKFVIVFKNETPNIPATLITPGKGSFITLPVKVDESVADGVYNSKLFNLSASFNDADNVQQNRVADDYNFAIKVDKASGVEDLVADQDANNGKYFDLMGREVSKPAKGIYVQNGKKVYVK